MKPRLIVLHYTAMATVDAALARLSDPQYEVSAHYLIAPRGGVFQLVDEADRAWHAGSGSWGGIGDVNSGSIGIELANDGSSPFPAALMDTLGQLLTDIMARWRIEPQGVIAHSDLAPQRKSDPGRRFDWRRLALEGVSVWPAPGAPQDADSQAFRSAAVAFGYPDAACDVLLEAYRQRFRPWARGPLDGWDVAGAMDLARRFAVDRGDASA